MNLRITFRESKSQAPEEKAANSRIRTAEEGGIIETVTMRENDRQRDADHCHARANALTKCLCSRNHIMKILFSYTLNGNSIATR